MRARSQIFMAAVLVAVGLSVPIGPQADVIEAIEAKVNGEIIFMRDIDESMLALAGGKKLEDLSDEEFNTLRWQVLAGMIQNRLIVQECKRLVKEYGIDQDLIANEVEGMLKRKIADFDERFETPDERAAFLKRIGHTEDSFETTLREEAETDYYRYRTAPSVIQDRIKPVTDEEVEQLRSQRPDMIRQMEWVEFSHIVLRCPPESDASAVEAAEKKFDGIKLKLKAGIPFEKLVQEYSEHEASRKQAGKMGRVWRGKFSEAWDDLVEALFLGTTNQLIGPLRSPHGLHLCVVTGKRDAKEALSYKHVDDALREWVDDILEREDTEIHIKGAAPGGVDIPVTSVSPRLQEQARKRLRQ